MKKKKKKKTRPADFYTDQIDFITNFAVITNVVIKRAHFIHIQVADGIALTRILETVVTFHFSGGKVYSMNKGCHTCMIKHTMHVQSLHCSTYLTWLDVCIYVSRSHFHFLKRMLGKGQFRTA